MTFFTLTGNLRTLPYYLRPFAGNSSYLLSNCRQAWLLHKLYPNGDCTLPKRKKNLRNYMSFSPLRPVHIVRFFLIATAILSITRNGLHRTQWKCSHYATATTSPTPMQPIVSKYKSQSQIAQCERALSTVCDIEIAGKSNDATVN